MIRLTPNKTVLLCIMTIISCAILTHKETRESYEKHLSNHPFLNRSFSEVSATKKRDRPDLAWELDFLLTMDPKTKKPEKSRLLEIYNKVKQEKQQRISTPGQETSPWVERGPTNIGGRTRGLVFDPAVNNKVWAGSVSGGLWFNNDITDTNSSWQAVDDFWTNLSISCIAFDPNNSNTIYVGTGEGWYNLDAVRGAGVWKSIDGGTTWNQLTASNNLFYVHDLVVRNESTGTDPGVLYVGTSNGLYQSVNEGNSFTEVANVESTNLCIATDNRIWSGTRNGRIIYSDNGTEWTESHNSGFGRVAIACAPSNANYVYALIENDNKVGTIIFSDDRGTTWNTMTEPADVDTGIPDNDFSRNQAWYDLVISVDPNDENTVIVGAIDLFKSTDNGNSWEQISKWSNNNNLAFLSASLVHADHHAIVFKGAGSNEVLFGNDGGVYYSTNLANAATQDVITNRNNNYNVTQFYAAAIHPEQNRSFFLAGAQDNGSHRFDSDGLNATTEVNGGDGAFCFIDQTDPDFQITSYVYNVYDLSVNGGQTFFNNLQNDQETGLFINPADYDDHMDILYSTRDANSINRISGITNTRSIDNFSINLGNMTSHLRVSPHTTSSTTLFAGTLSGRIFKIENADAAVPTNTEITSNLFPTGSISCIEIGVDENELLVTFSNYGITSVWFTSDGGTNWSNKEGDLPDMPVRWALFNPNDRTEVILATELGVWQTTNLDSSSPNWTASNSGLANVRTDMLQIRNSDNEVIAATHGRGLFSSNGFAQTSAPIVNFTADVTVACSDELSVNFSDLTTANPEATIYEWDFPGGSPASSQNKTPPTITYNAPGNYDVSLTVTNSSGTTSETKSSFIKINTNYELPFSQNFDSPTFPPDCWIISRGENELGTQQDWKRLEGENSGAAFVGYEDVVGGNAEDWLITPQIDLSNTIGAMLTFQIRQTYPTVYESLFHIMISTSSQTDLSTFSVVETIEEPDFSITLSQFNIDLAAYDGMSVYVAFVQDQDDGDDLYLDDIVFTGTSTLTISANNEFEVCPNESLELSTTENTAFTYQWKLNNTDLPNATESTYIPIESGEYSVEASSNGVSIESLPVSIDIREIAEIITQPADQIKLENEAVIFEISTTGSDLTHQWFFNNDSIFNNGNISGATTVSLNISAISASHMGNYHCTVVNECTDVLISETVSLQVNESIVISANNDLDICANEDLELSTIDNEAFSYQWKLNNTNIPDATASSYSPIESGEYSVEVSSSESSIESLPVSVNIGELAEIITQPIDQIALKNEAVIFKISTAGSDLTHQWFFNNDSIFDTSNITGATTTSLNISTISASHLGNYHCTVVNECSAILISESVSLQVDESIFVISANNDLNICANENLELSTTDNSTFSYQWKLNSTNIPDATKFTYIPIESGEYSVVVTTSDTSVESLPVSVNIIELAEIITQPVDQIALKNEAVIFEISTAGSDLTHQWFFNNDSIFDTSNITGATTTSLNISTISASDVGNYHCAVMNECPGILTSETASLQVDETTDIHDALLANLNFYPNPTSDYINLNLTGLSSVNQLNYSIFDLTGHIVQADIVLLKNELDTSHRINLADFSKGLYLIVLNLDGKISQQSVLVR